MEIRSILIVDDSKTSRMITRRCFEIAGYFDTEFIEAEDGIRAVTLLQQHEIDLIVSDLRMPRMDGSTFIRKLKMNDETKHIPVIVVSSMGNDVTEQQLKADGVLAVIRKPLNPEKVIDAIGGEA
jgi:two-component system, chemotaxis family, chemotaxis protein CheY